MAIINNTGTPNAQYATDQLYTHDELIGIVNEHRLRTALCLEIGFSREFMSNTKHINFDEIEEMPKTITPFVSAKVQGGIVQRGKFATRVLTPGYVKEGTTIDHDQVFTRTAGQGSGMMVSPSDRAAAAMAYNAILLSTRFQNRLELMASELLRLGKYSMKGEGVDETVDMGRGATDVISTSRLSYLNLVHRAGDTYKSKGGAPTKWVTGADTDVLNTTALTAGTADPFADITKWLQALTSPCKAIIVGRNAWAAIQASEKFDKQITLDSRMNMGMSSTHFTNLPIVADNRYVVQMGTLISGTVPILTYSQRYVKEGETTETDYIGKNEILFIPDSSFGVQCYATILDPEAGWTSHKEFYKSWYEKDPAGEILQLQSSPLLAHTQINATLCVDVSA